MNNCQNPFFYNCCTQKCCQPRNNCCNNTIPIPGPQGPAGQAATITVGSTITGLPGTQASVTNSGTTSNAVLNFIIPAGEPGANGATGPQGPIGPQGPAGTNGADGAAATITVGTTTTGEPGSQASVSNVGTSTNAILNFVIPRGETGATGPQGPAGESGTITPGVAVTLLDATATLDEVITTVNNLITSLTNAGFLA